MTYLIDTDWIINWLKGREKTVEKIKNLPEGGLAVSIISVAEIYEGVFGSKNTEKHENALQEFLSGVEVAYIDQKICKKFGELRNELRKKGNLVDDFDILIASSAISKNFIFTD